MSAKREERRTAARVPDGGRRAARADSQARPIRFPRNRLHIALAGKNRGLGWALILPDLDRAIIAGRGLSIAVGAPAHDVDRAGMSTQGIKAVSVLLQIEHIHGPVFRRRGDRKTDAAPLS